MNCISHFKEGETTKESFTMAVIRLLKQEPIYIREPRKKQGDAE